MIGRVLDRYRIEAQIGAGGMGVVYRARDTELDRIVAIKVLPQDAIPDPLRKERFLREARAASALNHPGIVTIHDIRSDGDIDFIVMEYVAGKTLDQAIRQDHLSSEQVLKYGVEIADAMARAHEAGIIHRDLKPSNLMVTDAGRIKVLDFGLAKLHEAAAADKTIDVTTMGSPRTEAGVAVGTVAYMSPEQAEGRPVDTRSDIFSLGAVLYEMATGTKPFAGASSLHILARVLNEEPTLPSAINPAIPPDFEKTIGRCLRKDPSRRFQTMADLKAALEDAADQSGRHPSAVASASRQRWMWPTAAALFLALVAVAIWRFWPAAEPPAPEPLTAVPLTTLPGIERRPSFSPDGDRVAFSWNGPAQDNSDIYVQQIGSGTPLRLTTDPGSDYTPAWSPDGRWIAFLRGAPSGTNEVRLVPPLGGPERKVGDTRPHRSVLRSSTIAWCPDSTCLIVTDSLGDAEPDVLVVLSIDSGEKRQLTFPDASPMFADVDPAPSPDGNWLAFRRQNSPATGALNVVAIGRGMVATGKPRRLVPENLNGTYPAWTRDSMNVVFSGNGALWRMAIGSDSPPVRVPFIGEDGLMPAIARSPQDRGRLVYVRRYSDSNIWRVDTGGPGQAALRAPAVAIASTREEIAADLSPDGSRVVFASNRSGPLDIWVADLDGSNAVQLSSSIGVPGFPRWSPDGQRIAFHSNPEGTPEIMVVAAAGGRPQILTGDSPLDTFPSFSRDGRWMYSAALRAGQPGLWKLPLAEGAPLKLKAGETAASSESRDGAFVYYMDYFDRPSAVWRISSSGGMPIKVFDGAVGGGFAVIDQGIYYLDRESNDTRLQFFDFASNTSKTIARGLGNVSFGLTASADGRTILYSRIDSSVDDLMLVENFR